MKKSKATQQTKHAIRRARERYEINIDDRGLDDIVDLIQKGKALFIESQSNRLSLFKVSYDGHSPYVIYDKSRQTIVTFLTDEMVKERSLMN